MEQNANFIGGMPGQDVDPAQLQEALNNVMKQNAQASTPSLTAFSQMQQQRAERMNAAASTLTQVLGKDHPDVLALQSGAAAVATLNAHVETQTMRLKTWPRPRANEWVVFGTVVDAQDNPVSGATVRVYDKDRKYDDLLGETETGANGEFAIVYHERDFKESNENLPELYVMVTDAKGQQVYSSRDSVRYKSGQSEYFAIRLGQPGRTPKAETTPKPAAGRATRATKKKG